MCFIKDHTNFIQQKIIVAMNGLAEEECLKNYDLIKEDTRRRLKQSYLSCDDKVSFYKDSFSILSFYETDYLMTNLLFEKDKSILLHLTNDDTFKSNLNFRIENSFSEQYFEVYKISSTEIEIINTLLLDEKLFNFSQDELNASKIPLENTIINKLSLYFVDGLDQSKYILLYYIFIKWLYTNKSTDYINTSLLLYAKIDRENNVKLYENFQVLENLLSNLFYFEKINRKSDEDYLILPLFTKLEIESKGLLKQKEKFEKNLVNSKIVSKSKLNKTFTPIFKLLEEEQEERKIDQYINVLKEKIDNFELPDNFEKDYLIKIVVTDYTRIKLNDIKRRLYLY
jgi:hypothetical protein